MDVIHVKFEETKRESRKLSSFNSQSNQIHQNELHELSIDLKQRANAILNFVGLWKNNIGQKIAQQLVKFEAMMT